MRFRSNMQRSEFINGAPADLIDPMAEEAIGFELKRTPPSPEPMLSGKTKIKEGIIRKNGNSFTESSPLDAEKSSSSTNIQLKIDSSPPTARMQLEDICTCNNWEQPTYVLCKEEGPEDEKMFTFKVIVGVDGISMTILECFSGPKPHQIAAQEHAAESAIWYLNHLGYSSNL